MLPGFLGHVLAAACYVVEHPIFGNVAFGGDVQSQEQNAVSVQPRDSVRRRVYLAPLGLWITIDAGVINEVQYNAAAKTASVIIGAKSNEKLDIVIKYEQTAQIEGVGAIQLQTTDLRGARGGYVVSVPEGGTSTVAFGAS